MRPAVAGAVLGLVLGWIAAPGINKTQAVRIVDVVVLGPWLVLLAAKPRHTPMERTLLAFFGGATASYNLRNLLKYQRQGAPIWEPPAERSETRST